jgi:hypothetical protein
MRLAELTLLVLSLLPAFAQTHELDKEKSAALLEAAAKEGVTVPAKTTTSTVQDSVGVTAVLLTQGSVRRLFGKEISDTYAAVQITISNKSSDAEFVLHSAYIDTSQWALGAGTHGFSVDGNKDAARTAYAPNRISSVEARIARGELLDAQQWTRRNWTIRLLTLAGSLASGYSFAFKETGIAKGIAAFNGNFVPGVAVAWPDGSVAQLNRISDFGYQTNKVVAKQNADIIVCFFPIDMFLAEPFQRLFLKSPALFLAPYQILYTQDAQLLDAMDLKADDLKALRVLHACYSKTTEPDNKSSEHSALFNLANDAVTRDCAEILTDKKNEPNLLKLAYIGRFGIENIGVYVDGIMTVNVDTVPCSIDSVTFDGDPSKAAYWTTPGKLTGSVRCRLSQDGATVNIDEAESLGLKDLTTTKGSDAETLNFSFTTTKAIASGQKLTFTVSKKPADTTDKSQPVKSSPFPYTVSYGAAITDITVKDKSVTVAGTGLVGSKDAPLSVVLHPDGKDKDMPVTLPAGQEPGKLTFDTPDLEPGCWSVQVKLGSQEVTPPKTQTKILAEAKPEITGATRATDSILVTGEQLVDTTRCGGKALTFRLQHAAASRGAQPKPVEETSKLTSSTGATLKPAAKPGSWTVQLLQGGKVVSSMPLK